MGEESNPEKYSRLCGEDNLAYFKHKNDEFFEKKFDEIRANQG